MLQSGRQGRGCVSVFPGRGRVGSWEGGALPSVAVPARLCWRVQVHTVKCAFSLCGPASASVIGGRSTGLLSLSSGGGYWCEHPRSRARAGPEPIVTIAAFLKERGRLTRSPTGNRPACSGRQPPTAQKRGGPFHATPAEATPAQSRHFPPAVMSGQEETEDLPRCGRELSETESALAFFLLFMLLGERDRFFFPKADREG